MDIRQVRLGEYFIGNSQGKAAKNNSKEAGETQTQQTPSQEVKNFNVDGMFNAMNIAGMQNLSIISKNEQKMVDPANYLSEERISDIEAMMAGFENGVNMVANTIEAEFPGVFDDKQKNALAAGIFAKES